VSILSFASLSACCLLVTFLPSVRFLLLSSPASQGSLLLLCHHPFADVLFTQACIALSKWEAAVEFALAGLRLVLLRSLLCFCYLFALTAWNIPFVVLASLSLGA
jgi:hypothetical protein